MTKKIDVHYMGAADDGASPADAADIRTLIDEAVGEIDEAVDCALTLQKPIRILNNLHQAWVDLNTLNSDAYLMIPPRSNLPAEAKIPAHFRSCASRAIERCELAMHKTLRQEAWSRLRDASIYVRMAIQEFDE